MPGMKEIKNRIHSVSDTRKITNAMYLIASTKLRRARANLDATAPFFNSLRDEMARIFQTDEEVRSVYFGDREQRKKSGTETCGILAITADKGLAGSYNSNILKEMVRLTEEYERHELYVVGEVGRHFCELRNIAIDKSFLYTAQNPSGRRCDMIAHLLLERFRSGELDKVIIVYTDLNGAATLVVRTEELLPLKRADSSGGDKKLRTDLFEYHPDLSSVLDAIVPGVISGYIFGALTDSFCCEQSARMMAMDAANSNASELLEELKLEYNHVRQNAITREITEVAAGAKAKRAKRSKKK